MQSPPQQDQRPSINGILCAVGLLFFVLILRLFYLQIITSADYARESEENRIAQRRVKAPRGLIFDRYRKIGAGQRRTTGEGKHRRPDRQSFEDVHWY